MKKLIISLVVSLLMVAAVIFYGASAPSVSVPLQPLDAPIPTATVTLPPVTLSAPGKTVTLPGKTVTLTTHSIKVPVPTKRVTIIKRLPRRTVTVFLRPRTVTRTVRVPLAPETIWLTRQVTPTRGTVSPSPRIVTKPIVETRTRTETIVRRVFLGTLVSILFLLLGVAGLFIGYALGTRDAYRKDDKFLNGLLERATYRRQH